MAITVTEPTATRDSNLSYYVASDNPIIFTFTAGAGETQAQLQIYDDTTGTGVLINSFDIVLSFDASNEIDFDVSPYLRSLISNINDFNYTSDSSADTNASIKFYIDKICVPIFILSSNDPTLIQNSCKNSHSLKK